jgi:hypothetical protein
MRNLFLSVREGFFSECEVLQNGGETLVRLWIFFEVGFSSLCCDFSKKIAIFLQNILVLAKTTIFSTLFYPPRPTQTISSCQNL